MLSSLASVCAMHPQVIEIVKDLQGKSMVRVLPEESYDRSSSLDEEDVFEL